MLAFCQLTIEPWRRDLEVVMPGNRVLDVKQRTDGPAHGFAVLEADAIRVIDE